MVPGAGTIAGFVAGLVVGLGIDYWMTNQTAATLETELLTYINQIEVTCWTDQQATKINSETRG